MPYTNVNPIITGAGKNNTTTTGYFNNLGNPEFAVSQNTGDAIQGFFEGITGDVASATQLASAVIYTSLSNGAEPMSVLEEFQRVPKGQMSLYLATFLNLSRVGTSYLAVNNQKHVNQYIARSILV